MLTHNIDHSDIISAFKQRAEGKPTALTLGGTGPNAASQIVTLDHLGKAYVEGLDQVNLISGSAFGYFIWQAFFEGMLTLDAFAHFESRVRKIHRASFLNGLKHIVSPRKQAKALYRNDLIKQIALLLFEESFIEQPFSNFNTNLRIWAYCSNTQTCHAITPTSHPNMKLWEAICATSSVPRLYGHFDYSASPEVGIHRFSDPNFSEQSRQLNRRLLQWDGPHVFMNYKKTEISRNVLFLKNETSKLPNLQLMSDFAMFILNIPNRKVTRTHADTLQTLRATLATSFKSAAPLEPHIGTSAAKAQRGMSRQIEE